MNLLTGFPRCGNTWALYIINYLGGIDSPAKQENRFKVVSPNHLAKGGKGCTNMLMVIRNYKECMVRHYGEATVNGFKGKIDKFWKNGPSNSGYRPAVYIDNLNAYDNFENPKILIYYEDLIGNNSSKEIKRIAEFMEEHMEKKAINRSELFFKNLNFHTRSSYNNYTDPQSSGKEEIFHSKKLDHKIIKGFDRYFENNHSELVKKYLKRYIE